MATAPSLPLQCRPLNSTPSTASNASTLKVPTLLSTPPFPIMSNQFGGSISGSRLFRLRFGQAEGAVRVLNWRSYIGTSGGHGPPCPRASWRRTRKEGVMASGWPEAVHGGVGGDGSFRRWFVERKDEAAASGAV
ncbi:hypothetical protein Droror1_Dr00000389, partial [Drosera rotundifolia]